MPCGEGFANEFSTTRIRWVTTHVHSGSTLNEIYVNFTVSPLSSPKCTRFKIGKNQSPDQCIAKKILYTFAGPKVSGEYVCTCILRNRATSNHSQNSPKSSILNGFSIWCTLRICKTSNSPIWIGVCRWILDQSYWVSKCTSSFGIDFLGDLSEFHCVTSIVTKKYSVQDLKRSKSRP
jgi:hypothetical protein